MQQFLLIKRNNYFLNFQMDQCISQHQDKLLNQLETIIKMFYLQRVVQIRWLQRSSHQMLRKQSDGRQRLKTLDSVSMFFFFFAFLFFLFFFGGLRGCIIVIFFIFFFKIFSILTRTHVFFFFYVNLVHLLSLSLLILFHNLHQPPTNHQPTTNQPQVLLFAMLLLPVLPRRTFSLY